MWPVVRGTGRVTIRVSRLDAFSLDVPPAAACELLIFDSDWGQEFEPVLQRLEGQIVRETRTGRSSKGQHPWFALFREGGGVLSGAIAWSGNWIFRFEPLSLGGYRVSGGLNDWEFSKDLSPGSEMESPHAVLVLGGDLNAVSQQYARVGRQHWYPRNALSASLPVEWNHWWPYKDVEISQQVFAANVETAARLGIEVCTLDAGWFGPGESSTHWYDFRGDWDRVQAQRFPGGIRQLSDDVHRQGMRFGLWCEIEGLGNKARLAQQNPGFSAACHGQALGYVCFGNPEVQEWAYRTLSGLISDYNCDWIKLDFNLDPGAGCDRIDHGHGAMDGLYAHYQGYYHTLERLRQAFPEVMLENCSSGGLRIDLGILRRTHLTFLSDPDWPVHSLQVFWGASTMLAPQACLHWSFSQWWSGGWVPPKQNFDPQDPALSRRRLDYFTRIAMLGACGFSQKLHQLPGWVSARLAEHIRIYQEHIRHYVSAADLFRLTSQPRRDGSGERWCAFQYSLPDGSRHLLFVFRLPGGEVERTIFPLNLQPERVYSIAGFEGESLGQRSGQELMARGLKFNNLEEEDSALLEIT